MMALGKRHEVPSSKEGRCSPPLSYRPCSYRMALPEMIFLAPCTPAVNANVGTCARQYARPIPPGRVFDEDITAASRGFGPGRVYTLRAAGHCTGSPPQAILA